MKRMQKIMFLGTLGAAWTGLAQTEPLALSDRLVAEMASGKTPTSQRVLADVERSNLAASQFQEKFQTEFYSEISRGDTNKLAAAPFAPTFAPSEKIEVGLRRQFRYGMNGFFGAFADQVSTTDNSVTRSTSMGVKAGINLDLWSNFLGKLDQLNSGSLELSQKASEIRGRIEGKSFVLSVRQIYWALVANAESINVTAEMLKFAQSQLAQARERQANSVASESEVPRNASQVASHQAALTALKFQRESLLLNLKNLLPDLSQTTITLSYDLNRTMAQVLSCSAKINGHKQVPWDFTQHDDLIRLIQQQQKQSALATDRYDAGRLNLFAETEYSGRGRDYSGGLEQAQQDPRFGYQVGLKLALPLGGSKAQSQRHKQLLDHYHFEAQRTQILADLEARHVQMGSLIELLQVTVQQRQTSSRLLERSIKATTKMYNQARVPIDTLINEQNALLANQIDVIKTKQLVISELLDYLKIFTELDCALNGKT